MEEADNGKDLHLLEMKLPLEASISQDMINGQRYVGIETAGYKNKKWSDASS